MATLTTTDGIQITFVAKAVAALADHDASTGEALTCVYGIIENVLRINEPVPDFHDAPKNNQQFCEIDAAERFPSLDQWGRCFLDPRATPE